MRIAVAALAVLAAALAGCATTAPVVDASTALTGHDMTTALGLYGQYDQKVMLQGRPHYIWRRAVLLNGETYYCELRAETGFRDTIRSSVVQGYPAACGLFSVRYTSSYDAPRTTAAALKAASAGDVGENASSRTR